MAGLRNEIIAVAPKKSMLNLEQQTSSTTYVSMSTHQSAALSKRKSPTSSLKPTQPTIIPADKVRLITHEDSKVDSYRQDTEMSQADIRRKKRENSFIRDGYEVYVEGFYIINGKKKKKIKKRKLSRQVIDRHNRIL